nr:transposase [Clostridium gasigenes]
MNFQNQVLKSNGALLNENFNRITIVDGTSFKLDDNHQDYYKGSGVKASVKIQLQYDLLTCEFIHCDLNGGNYSDASYIETLQSTIQKQDLILKDLGYLKALDLKIIDKKSILSFKD